MRSPIKISAGIILGTVIGVAILVLVARAYGIYKDIWDFFSDLIAFWRWHEVLSPETKILLALAFISSVVLHADKLTALLRRTLGIPDPVPQLEFIWSDESGQRLHHSLRTWDVIVTVRNPSYTQTLTSVRAILEWWMQEDHYRKGAHTQANDRPLQMQHAPQFECTLAPRDRATFRLCSMVGSGEEHSLVIAPRDSGDHFNAGAGTFVFNVRASADNALSAWDFYKIGAANYGALSTTRDTAAAKRPAA